jgi:DNA-binding SARP family transcriptional activator
MARAHLQARAPRAFAEALSHADEVATHQKSPVQQRLAAVLRAIGQDGRALSRLLTNWPAPHDALSSVFAREIVGVLGELTDDAFGVVARAARATPHRWLPVLREYLPTAGMGAATRTASILEDIGEAEDIPRLRVAGRRLRQVGTGSWGDSLILRLAPRVVVEDLGLISISVGIRQVDGRDVRRKALALLAYLACQPRGAATPDRVIDVLWPDQDPEQGGNSLHQTIYFLRRVIEPGYRAGMSPEYVHYDTEVVSLDSALVDCRSWECQRLLSQRPETKQLVESLIAIYQGQFAADFPYEDWAAGYRDRLHARYLSVVERAIKGAAIQASPQWRLWVGQQCLAVDPEADTIEAQVIRLYHEIGAPAAAAEQYAHYAAMLRDHLGVEPPQLGEILGDTL